MATTKKGKKAGELVPTDDPAVSALWERESESMQDTLRRPLNEWISCKLRSVERASNWLRAAIQQDIDSYRALPLMLDLLPMLDEARVIDALWAIGFWITGDHRNWIDTARFDDRVIDRDSVRRSCRASVLARLDAIIALAADPADAIRARAAFLLGWLGPTARERAVVALRACCSDRAEVVRGSAVISLAMHGERESSLLDDPDARVRLCAAIAASWSEPSERARAILEAALDEPMLQWSALAFNEGALSACAILRYAIITREQPERMQARFVAALRSALGPALVPSVIAAAFWRYAEQSAPSAMQRAVAAVIVERVELHNPAVPALRVARAIPMASFETVDVLIDGLRASFGLPRPPPTVGSRTTVTVRGRGSFAQHWMADFAVAPQPELAAEIAGEIAMALTVDELVELLSRWSQDIDGSALSYARVASVAYEVALPEGVERRDGRLVRRPEEWAVAHRAWCADREREGWLSLLSWWSGEEVVTRWFDLRGRSLEVTFGHEWNSGNPIRTEARVVVAARHRLTPLVARAARAKDPSAFDAVMEAQIAANARSGSWNANRATQIAIEAFAGTGEAPPAYFDGVAALMQRTWTYVTGALVPYARLLPADRREALAITCATQTNYALPLLYELAPTQAVLDAISPALKRALLDWPKYIELYRSTWERALGADGAARIIEACGPAPVVEKPKRRRR